jgi:hypothetical protein
VIARPSSLATKPAAEESDVKSAEKTGGSKGKPLHIYLCDDTPIGAKKFKFVVHRVDREQFNEGVEEGQELGTRPAIIVTGDEKVVDVRRRNY